MQYVLLPLQMFLLTILQEILERERKMVITLWPDCEPTIAVFALFICHLYTPAFFFSACLLYFPWNQGRQLVLQLSPQASDCKVHKQACFIPLSTLPSPYETLEPWTQNATQFWCVLMCHISDTNSLRPGCMSISNTLQDNNWLSPGGHGQLILKISHGI